MRCNAGDEHTEALVEVNALKAATIVDGALCVPLVLHAGSFAEITNSVVVTNAVDMVDLLLRPSAVDVEPRQPMCGIFHTFDGDADIAVTNGRSSALSGAQPVDTFFYSELAQFRVVVKYAQQLGMRDKPQAVLFVRSPMRLKQERLPERLADAR